MGWLMATYFGLSSVFNRGTSTVMMSSHHILVYVKSIGKVSNITVC